MRLILSVSIGSLLMSCTVGSYYATSYDTGYLVDPGESYDDFEGRSGYANYAVDKAKIQEVSKPKKIIYSASVSLQVKDKDSTNIKLVEIAKAHNGYAQQTGSYQAVIRVKNDQLASALAQVEKLGKVTSKSSSGRDVTEQYLDLEIRLDNAMKARKRYLELLDMAKNVDDALKVEKELERLNTTIDLLKGKMNKMSNQADFATITVRLNDKVKPGILGYVGIGLYKSVRWLFVRG